MSQFQQASPAPATLGAATNAPLGHVPARAASLSVVQNGFAAPLSGLSLIAVTGVDAADFLHNQLTNDVLHLAEPGAPGFGVARLAGYCSPKGRLLATLLIWQSGETIWLQVPGDIAAALQKRLTMFVLRAKVKLHAAAGNADWPQQQAILGLGGHQVDAALRQWFPALPAQAYATLEHELGTLIRVADAFGAPRYQWLCSTATMDAVLPALSNTLAAGGNEEWQLAAIHAGVPQIGLATQEKFVPQMINFEVIGGVNFKKGCYPGQEIVARSQYLGTLKRRMLLASVAAADVVAGAEVFAAADPGQPCGMVVNAALVEADGAACAHCLVEIKIALQEQGPIHLGSPDGPVLAWLAMPYSLAALDV